MIEKIKAQICFAGDANLDNVRKQLKELKNKDDEFEFYCCFLPRHIVIEKNFNTNIVDMLEDELGCSLKWQLIDCHSFDEAINKLPQIREETANLVNRMFVLDSGTAKGVKEEIMLFTRCKVILM